jgi:uncharacterized protein
MKSISILLIVLSLYSCNQKDKSKTLSYVTKDTPKTFEEKLSDAAIFITDPSIEYDPAYFSIKYPNGDIPAIKGVCTDVIIRSYRRLGIDLQKEVHEDMVAHFSEYPN